MVFLSVPTCSRENIIHSQINIWGHRPAISIAISIHAIRHVCDYPGGFLQWPEKWHAAGASLAAVRENAFSGRRRYLLRSAWRKSRNLKVPILMKIEHSRCNSVCHVYYNNLMKKYNEFKNVSSGLRKCNHFVSGPVSRARRGFFAPRNWSVSLSARRMASGRELRERKGSPRPFGSSQSSRLEFLRQP